MYSYGPPYMAEQKQDDQLEHTYSSYVRIRNVAVKTCQRRWTIRWSGERGSGISVLAARHDDDDIYANKWPLTHLKIMLPINYLLIYSYGPPHMAEQKQDDQLEHTYSSYVRIRNIAVKTCQRRWTIRWSGERGSGISVLAARRDDDDIYANKWPLTHLKIILSIDYLLTNF